jgi:sugar phosphate isomerase/epimerase
MMAVGPLRFGFVQGRLVPTPGPLQWFPQDCWEEEFDLAKSVGADYIELIAEREHNANNPLWEDHGIARLSELAAQNGMTMTALCDDFVIDHCLADSADTLDQVLRVIRQGERLGCRLLVLPLFEQSELTQDNARRYLAAVRKIGDAAARSGLIVCLETNLPGQALLEFLHQVDHANVQVVYDTGNRVAFGHDLPGDIRLLGSHVRHVHIKDKNVYNENVLLGTGLVDFLKVFKALGDVGYGGSFTFETTRGRDPRRTATYNMNFVVFFAAEVAPW